MGDASIAQALKEGVGQAVELLGETLTFTRVGSRDIDGSDPSRYVVTRPQSISVEGMVSDIEDKDIDGIMVKVGDKIATIVGGELWPGEDGEEFVPAVGDRVVVGNIQYNAANVKTNRVAGIDTSFEVLLR